MINELHQSPYSVHPGYQKTITVARKLHFWPSMKKDVTEYIAKCQKCQQVKVEHQHLAGLLQPLANPEWKWEIIFIDFITEFPMTAKQHDSIMVVVDKFSKATHFVPVKSTLKANDIARIFMEEIIKLHGIPKAIVSNRDAQFTANFWKGLFQDLGT